MIKKTVKYVDYNGRETTEELYFDMSALAFTKFAAKYSDFSNIDLESDNSVIEAVRAFLDKIIKENDLSKMIEFLEEFILSAYGEKASDGKHFFKTKEIKTNFENSLAFAQIFEDLILRQDSIQPFVAGVLGLEEVK